MEEFLDHQPYSEEEALGLLNPGIYPGYFSNIEIKQASNGVKYFVATVDVADPTDKRHVIITTWLALKHLLKHAYDAAGLEDKFKENRLSTRDLEGKKVLVKIKHSKVTEKYPVPRNEIADFIKPTDDILLNDDLSFL